MAFEKSDAGVIGFTETDYKSCNDSHKSYWGLDEARSLPTDWLDFVRKHIVTGGNEKYSKCYNLDNEYYSHPVAENFQFRYGEANEFNSIDFRRSDVLLSLREGVNRVKSWIESKKISKVRLELKGVCVDFRERLYSPLYGDGVFFMDINQNSHVEFVLCDVQSKQTREYPRCEYKNIYVPVWSTELVTLGAIHVDKSKLTTTLVNTLEHYNTLQVLCKNKLWFYTLSVWEKLKSQINYEIKKDVLPFEFLGDVESGKIPDTDWLIKITVKKDGKENDVCIDPLAVSAFEYSEEYKTATIRAGGKEYELRDIENEDALAIHKKICMRKKHAQESTDRLAHILGKSNEGIADKLDGIGRSQRALVANAWNRTYGNYWDSDGRPL